MKDLINELKALCEDYRVELPNELTQLMNEMYNNSVTWVSKLREIQRNIVGIDYKDNATVYYITDLIDRVEDLQNSCHIRKD